MMKIYLCIIILFYILFLGIGFITGKFILLNKKSYEYLIRKAIDSDSYTRMLGIQFTFISIYLIITVFINLWINNPIKEYFLLELIIFFIINGLIEHQLKKLKN